MSVITFDHDRAKAHGLDVNSHSSFPPDCYIRTFVGCVLDVYERNGYDDSDFFATVWDEEQQKVRDVMYATTRGWTYNNGAHVDATDEVMAKAAAYWTAQHRKTIEARIRREMAGAYVGATATIIRGRKAPKGFTGVIRMLEKRVNPYAPQPRYRTGAWDTSELHALVENDKAAWTVKAEYLEIQPNPEAIEAAVAKALAEYDVNAARCGNALSWRSQKYQAMEFAGIRADRIPA